MTIIKDLGVKDLGTYRKRMCIAKCESCGDTQEKAYSYIKNNKNTVCKSCAMKKIHSDLGNGNNHKRLYSIWRNIKTRCYNQNYVKRKDYGGRGIVMCDNWRTNFKEFESWALSNGYSDNLSIDRIDNDGNYEPSNCRWATYSTQAKNTKRLRADNKTGFRGVVFVDNKFLSQITVNKQRYNLGRYETAEKAAEAYDSFVIENELEHTLNFKGQI